MRHNGKKWMIRLGAGALAAGCLVMGAALAAGDQEGPLVTLSYLNQTAIPQIVEQVEDRTAQRQEELEESFRTQLNQYQQGNQGGETASAGYTLVTLAQGQVMQMEVGCEVLLRVGSASVQADSSPALIDLSAGGTADGGAALEKNHLYMSTIEGRTLTADAATVKVLVRGGYTVA